MVMDLKFVVLKMLSKSPMHGYSMKSKVSELFGYELSSGALYPAFHELEESGLITSKKTVEQGKFKKVYSITEKGRKAMIEIEKVIMKLMDVDRTNVHVKIIKEEN